MRKVALAGEIDDGVAFAKRSPAADAAGRISIGHMVPIGVRLMLTSGARRRGNDGHQAMTENRHEGAPTYTAAPQPAALREVA